MKRQLFSVFIFLSFIFLLSSGSAYPFKNEPDGFNDIKWGTDIGFIKGLRYAYSKKGADEIKVYKKDDAIKKFGKAEIAYVEYEFYKGKFASVTLKVKDLYNFILLRDYCFRIFGRGSALVPKAERYFWDGEKTHIILISKYDIS